MFLKDECGSTDSSLVNASFMVERYGAPDRVILRYIEHPWDYVTILEWDKQEGEEKTPVSLELTGFSWGYNGTGPNGLAKFLASISDRDHRSWIKEIAAIDRDIHNYEIYKKLK